jgi:hypothetical protein
MTYNEAMWWSARGNHKPLFADQMNIFSAQMTSVHTKNGVAPIDWYKKDLLEADGFEEFALKQMADLKKERESKESKE